MDNKTTQDSQPCCWICNVPINRQDIPVCPVHCENAGGVLFHPRCLRKWNSEKTDGLEILTWREQKELERKCPACNRPLYNHTLIPAIVDRYVELMDLAGIRENLQEQAEREMKNWFSLGRCGGHEDLYQMSCCLGDVSRADMDGKALGDSYGSKVVKCPICHKAATLYDLYHITNIGTMTEAAKSGLYCCSCGEYCENGLTKIKSCGHFRCESCEELRVVCNVCWAERTCDEGKK